MSEPLIDPRIINWLNTVHEGASGSLRREAPNLYLERSRGVESDRLDSAICSHLEWRDRLEAFFADADEARLDRSIVSRDDLCPLGRWMQGEGREKLGRLPAFCQLERAHADFHRIVGEIIMEAQAGHHETARARLDQREYIDASWRVIDAISGLAVALNDPS